MAVVLWITGFRQNVFCLVKKKQHMMKHLWHTGSTEWKCFHFLRLESGGTFCLLKIVSNNIVRIGVQFVPRLCSSNIDFAVCRLTLKMHCEGGLLKRGGRGSGRANKLNQTYKVWGVGCVLVGLIALKNRKLRSPTDSLFRAAVSDLTNGTKGGPWSGSYKWNVSNVSSALH